MNKHNSETQQVQFRKLGNMPGARDVSEDVFLHTLHQAAARAKKCGDEPDRVFFYTV